MIIRHVKSIILSMALLAVLLATFSVGAQGNGLRLLVSSINPENGSVAVFWLNMAGGVLTPVASFNSPSYCPPQMIPSRNLLLYEPVFVNQSSFVYQIDLGSGNIVPVPGTQELSLRCPVVSKTAGMIAWLQQIPGSAQTHVIITNLDGSDPTDLAVHRQIYDAVWSPDGKILLYTAVDDDETFRALYAHSAVKTTVWQRDQGLLVDYAWLPDGSALLVGYYTQDNAIIGRLSRDCVVGGGCAPQPLAMFPLETGLILSDAFSPDGSATLVLTEGSTDTNQVVSEMYRIGLNGGGAIRLTYTADLIKTSPIWTKDNRIFLIGSSFDTSIYQFTGSAIYQLVPENAMQVAYQQEGFYPAQIIWWDE